MLLRLHYPVSNQTYVSSTYRRQIYLIESRALRRWMSTCSLLGKFNNRGHQGVGWQSGSQTSRVVSIDQWTVATYSIYCTYYCSEYCAQRHNQIYLFCIWKQDLHLYIQTVDMHGLVQFHIDCASYLCIQYCQSLYSYSGYYPEVKQLRNASHIQATKVELYAHTKA